MARLFGLIGNRADLSGRVLDLEGDALRVPSGLLPRGPLSWGMRGLLLFVSVAILWPPQYAFLGMSGYWATAGGALAVVAIHRANAAAGTFEQAFAQDRAVGVVAERPVQS